MMLSLHNRGLEHRAVFGSYQREDQIDGKGESSLSPHLTQPMPSNYNGSFGPLQGYSQIDRSLSDEIVVLLNLNISFYCEQFV